MKVILQHNHILTQIPVSSVVWSGEKTVISRKLSVTTSRTGDSALPIPKLGHNLILEENGQRLFKGVVLHVSTAREGKEIALDAYDLGYYLQRNQGTWRFDGASPEQITRTVCAERGITVWSLPTTGVHLRRKFSATSLADIVKTVWSLAGAESGKSYTCRYDIGGLVVKERTVAASRVILDASANLMEATITEDAAKMTNRVAIYDSDGNLIRKLGDLAAQQRLGIMEQHLQQSKDDPAQAEREAQRILREEGISTLISARVLGPDPRLISGETVEIRDSAAGLRGTFWIDSDRHVYKDGVCEIQLTLNLKNLMPESKAGSELEKK